MKEKYSPANGECACIACDIGNRMEKNQVKEKWGRDNMKISEGKRGIWKTDNEETMLRQDSMDKYSTMFGLESKED